MTLNVAVWGTGNVGRPAIRAVLSHADLDLAGVIVASAGKVGLDAGDIAGVDKTTGMSFEKQWCSNTGAMGVAVLGDSAAAHFELPPAWLNASAPA